MSDDDHSRRDEFYRDQDRRRDSPCFRGRSLARNANLEGRVLTVEMTVACGASERQSLGLISSEDRSRANVGMITVAGSA
jgi:hypothetical protein